MLLLAINDPNLEVLVVTAVSDNDNVNINKATTNAPKIIEAGEMKSASVYRWWCRKTSEEKIRGALQKSSVFDDLIL